MSITLLLLILCISSLFYAYALSSDGGTLLSLSTHWTFVSSTWNTSDSNPCLWVGIQCDHAHNVVSLNLPGQGILGQLGPEIGQLHHLKTLDLSNNRLNGELPLEIAKLIHLKNISLFNNSLSGVIPQSLGINSSLVKLDLTMNVFTGSIPPNLCFGKQLCVLNMGFNQLQGSIPSDVGRCATLSMLILSENNLTGSLPDFESNLNLKYMHISKNNISGPISYSLENCTNLAVINFSMNKFTGFIPASLGKLVNLVVLDLGHNNLEGPLPQQLSNCTRMDRFDVGFNFLDGSFPTSLRSWTRITTLILRENRFTGGIPVFFSEFNMLRELQLGGNLFGGEIPPSLGNLQNLFYGLNLSGNGLTGVIPLELGRLPMLLSLDLSFNNLTGSTDVLHEFNSWIEINISHNLLHGPLPVPRVYDSTDHKGISKLVIVVIGLGSSLFFSSMLVRLVWMHFRKQELNASNEQWSMPSVIERREGKIGILYKEHFKFYAEKPASSLYDIVMEATDNLNDHYIIGRGAHGVVYKAYLGGLAFAAKKVAFGRNKRKRLGIMRKEIEILGKIRHRNLVRYAGYWVGEDCGIVLSEYLQNGSLHDILHEKNPPPCLSWNVRFKIAVGIAHGLEYLHYDCVPPVVHRDIKPKNILLDADMEPLIADFGTALFRNLAEHSDSNCESTQTLSACVAGTPGYIAPENAYAIVQSRKSDVYSYGVVLLELITRKRVLIEVEDERQVITLVSWARAIWVETGEIDKIVDSYLASAFPNTPGLTKQVTEVLLLALRCTDRDARQRPTMKGVLGFYQRGIFKRGSDYDVVHDDAEVAIDVAPPPYNVPVVSTNPVSNTQQYSSQHGESSGASNLRHRQVTFNEETEAKDSNHFSWLQDANEFQLGVYAFDDWKLMSTPTTGVDGLIVKLMGSGKIHVEQVVTPALVVPKVTYSWPYLIFLPTTIGPGVTQPFNWFFLSRLAQYMHQQKSLNSQHSLLHCYTLYIVTPIRLTPQLSVSHM